MIKMHKENNLSKNQKIIFDLIHKSSEPLTIPPPGIAIDSDKSSAALPQPQDTLLSVLSL